MAKKIHHVYPAAIHEAGHVVMAQQFGVAGEIVVKRGNESERPNMKADGLDKLDTPAIVFVFLAGMAAERHMAREYGQAFPLSKCKEVGRRDLAILRYTGIRFPKGNLEKALDLAEEELSKHWQAVLRTAVEIQNAWDAGQDWVCL